MPALNVAGKLEAHSEECRSDCYWWNHDDDGYLGIKTRGSLLLMVFRNSGQ